MTTSMYKIVFKSKQTQKYHDKIISSYRHFCSCNVSYSMEYSNIFPLQIIQSDTLGKKPNSKPLFFNLFFIELFNSNIQSFEISEENTSPTASFYLLSWVEKRSKTHANVVTTIFDLNNWYMAHMPITHK